jgi:hypothetical protein
MEDTAGAQDTVGYLSADEPLYTAITSKYLGSTRTAVTASPHHAATLAAVTGSA